MRYKFRATRAVALSLTTFLLLCLYASNNLPWSLPQLPSFESTKLKSNEQAAESEPLADPDGIQLLWDHWSKVIYDNAPQTQHIFLSCNGPQISLSSDDHGPREPARNCVANPDVDIESIRSSHSAFLETLLSAGATADVFDGTGIVMMGGGEYFGPAIIGLHMLRKLGCTLPVEIFVADQTEYEPGVCEDYLLLYHARCVVLSEFLGAGSASGSKFDVTHYQLKSLAMLFSSFEEVLYLDSDSIPLVNPTTDLFATEPYISSGLVLWPDYWISTESPLFYKIAGLSFPSNLPKSSSEAGQILINKKTHLKSLLLATYYNVYGPEYYYPLLSQGVLGQGDKETFMAAALVIGEPYHRVKTGVSGAGYHTQRGFKSNAMIQYHPADDLLRSKYENSGMGIGIGTGNSSGSESEVPLVRPAFIHANTPKMNAGHLVDEGDLVGEDHKALRLWGPEDEQERIFGYDLERVIWELLRKAGCELALVIAEWKHRENLCQRLEEHWAEVY
jgi:alpha 1,2-mannosyltransferase